MTDERQPRLPLPPYRELPAPVRDRLRHRVYDELDPPESPRRRGFSAQVAVAAGAALLVAAGLLVGRFALGPHQVGSAPQVSRSTLLPGPFTGLVPVTGLPTTTTGVGPASPALAAVEKEDMQRCWNALVSQHKTAGYRSLADWVAVYQSTEDQAPDPVGGRTVTGIRASGTVFFCETTLTSVSVSTPTSVDARSAQVPLLVTMASDDGVLAGLVGDVREAATITTDGRLVEATLDEADGLFVGFGYGHGFAHSTVTVHSLFDSTPGAGTPVALPATALLVVDRPQPADRGSAAGHTLQTCLDTVSAQTGPLLDEASWQPGAATTSGTRLVITRNSLAVAVCLPALDYADGFWWDGSAQLDSPAVPLTVVYDDGTGAVAGLTDSDVGRIVFTSPDGGPVEADVTGQTFAATVPDLTAATVTVYDPAGKQIYQAPAAGLPTRARG